MTMFLDFVLLLVSLRILRQDVISRDLSESGWRNLPIITLSENFSIRTTFSASFFTSTRMLLKIWKIYVTWILGYQSMIWS